MNVIAVLSRYSSRNSQLRLLKHGQLSRRNNSQSSQAHQNESTPEADEQYDQNVKNKVLSASLPFVLELGWSKEALIKGAESVGYPGVTHGLFPQGGADLVHYFYSDCNEKLVEMLKKELGKGGIVVPSKMVNNAVETRLRMVVPYKSRWPQAIALMSLPPNVRQTLENLKNLADNICYYAGDRSVDFKWYARRFAIAGLYKTTELYMMQDQSEDHKKTWDFLNRRVEELFQIHEVLSQTESITEKSPDIFTSALTTMRNILRA